MKVWILLPAYNEENSLPKILPKIDATMAKNSIDYQVVVVDDGSTDNTQDVLKEYIGKYPVECLVHPINRGLGETERDGFEYIAAQASDDDLMVRFDCDDTHDPQYIIDLVNKLNEGYDVVNTSRFQPGGAQHGVNAYRTTISYLANIFMKLMFNIKGVKDYSCGFRVYKVRQIKDAISIFGNGFIQLKGFGFTSTLEVIVKLKILGLKFAEVPFELHYDKKASPSKMVSSITSMGYLTMAVLYHWPFSGWRSFYKNLSKTYRQDPKKAHDLYAKHKIKRPTICQLGG